MIQKYAPEDLSIWKEWLVYGTTLGVGDKVEKSMADMNISVPQAAAVTIMHTDFSHAYSASIPKSSGSGGGRGGGGFGGGGFGGGGGAETAGWRSEKNTIDSYSISRRVVNRFH
jgi:uncharacterized membrane protein